MANENRDLITKSPDGWEVSLTHQDIEKGVSDFRGFGWESTAQATRIASFLRSAV